MEQDVHMLLEGTIAELIVKLDPKLYRKDIWKSKIVKLMLCETEEGTVWSTTSHTVFL